MNFLAHLHLSDGTPGSMLGGILADFVKGPDVAALPPDILAGVRLHRHIDAFTDRHAVVQRSIHRVSAKLGWFAGIVIDIYYDHVLAREWGRYSPEPLRGFADRGTWKVTSATGALAKTIGDSGWWTPAIDDGKVGIGIFGGTCK